MYREIYTVSYDVFFINNTLAQNHKLNKWKSQKNGAVRSNVHVQSFT